MSWQKDEADRILSLDPDQALLEKLERSKINMDW